jgi:tetratricopeptide (TPR) repeat protein
MITTPAGLAELQEAVRLEQDGRPEEALTRARTLAEQGPDDARVLNDLGSLLNRLGRPGEAERQFLAALERAPGEVDFAINAAIAATKDGRPDAALRLLRRHEQGGQRIAKYWTVRARAHREAGELAAAEECYRAALAVSPNSKMALQGTAQIALERGRPDAVAGFDRALRGDPGNPYLWRGKAEALAEAGRLSEAVAIAEQVVAQAPRWTEGLQLMAQLRLAAQEADYAAPYREAARRHPNDPNIPAAWMEALSGLDHHEEAAGVAADAARRFPDIGRFRLLEAVHAGNAGDTARAGAIFNGLKETTQDTLLHEARHRLRARDNERAARCLESLLTRDPWHVSAWALTGLLWRLEGDERAEWLHEQEHLVQLLPLAAFSRRLPDLVEQLRALHARSALPLSQSLRGGTQTRGTLFGRHEPVFAELAQAISRTLEQYRSKLPEGDPSHPLLRFREAPWRFAGSWSVRLTGGGDHHAAHIHPEGIISSAAYLVLPEGGPEEGALELGRPPRDLQLDLPPLRTIVPEEGCLALFPSTLYHGTTAFSSGERITIAFDVVLRKETSS